MRKTLQLLAAFVAVATVTLWLATGANRGWTKTSVEKNTLDEVTGIESSTYEKKFVPGVELVAVGLFGAGVLAGVSFLFRRRNQTQT